MKFDWLAFLEREQIEYITEGKNVASGCYCIHCPICGAADPSQHCNIDPETGGWWCWRNRDHRGRAVYLVAALKGCSLPDARRIVGEDEQARADSPGADTLEDLRQRFEQAETPRDTKDSGPETWPGDIHPIRPDRASSRRFVDYLARRRFWGDAEEVARYYRLRYAMTGPFAQRLIIPITRGPDLIGWTGRSIRPDAELRYKSHPEGHGGVKSTLINCRVARRGGRVLVIVEGPLDALKLDFYGRWRAVRAVATMGTNVTDMQVGVLIHDLIPYYDRAVILFDPNADRMALQLQAKLRLANRPVRLDQVPPGEEDAGAFRPEMARLAAETWIKGLSIAKELQS